MNLHSVRLTTKLTRRWMNGQAMPAAERSTSLNRPFFASLVKPASSLTPRWARRIFETIGCYAGYGVAHYADFYKLRHVLILGRVTSGEGGAIILSRAQEVLRTEFPELAENVALHLPDESSRRVGQAVAAASLPALR